MAYQAYISCVSSDGEREEPLSDPEWAEEVCLQLGWALAEGYADDPAYGIWHVELPERDETELEENGFLAVAVQFGLGDPFSSATAEIELP